MTAISSAENASAIGPSIDWTAAIEANTPWLRTVLQSRLNDVHATEDLLQEIAVAVLQQASKPIEASKIAPWLYKIALRKVINYRRSLGRRRKLMRRFAENGLNSEVGDAAEWLMRSEQAGMVSKALRQLDEADRQLLLLKYSENWGYRELAEKLGVSVKTIEYRLFRAREAMRQQFEMSSGEIR